MSLPSGIDEYVRERYQERLEPSCKQSGRDVRKQSQSGAPARASSGLGNLLIALGRRLQRRKRAGGGRRAGCTANSVRELTTR